MADRAPAMTEKGLPWLADPVRDVAGWNIFDDQVALPSAVLRSTAIDHNIAVMADYCRQHGVLLAPHGKTTMSPELIGRQLAAGAWAITVATAWQAATVAEMGVRRILLANEIADAGSLALLARLLTAREDIELWCYVDSPQGLTLLAEGLPTLVRPQVRVLLELGIDGGRGGLRAGADALGLGQLVVAKALTLGGVAAFEGVIDGGSVPRTLELVDQLLRRCVDLALELTAAGLIGVPDPIVTVGGSAYFDRVVAVAAPALAGTPWRTVLRSGCYLTHDSGTYDQISPLAGRGTIGGARLEPALQVLAAVLSLPEPGRAIVGFGRRDASFDAGLPIPLFVRRDGKFAPVPPGWAVVTVNDQHAYLDIPHDCDLVVGQVLAFGISHPCTTFDKWRVLPIVDPNYRVIELAHTHF